MAKTDIDWCNNPDGTPGHSLNIIKGCGGPAGDGVHCKYCYACRMVKRFGFAERVTIKEMELKYGEYVHPGPLVEKIKKESEKLVNKIKSFKPHFFEYVYAQKLRKKPTMYFFSMSDPADWDQSWYERIVEKIRQYPQHTFVVLTKRPRVYGKYIFPENVWCGITATNEIGVAFAIGCFARMNLKNLTFLSIEPIHGKIRFDAIKIDIWKHINWFIVGPETGTHKKTPTEWLDPFFPLDIPVFMKDSWGKYTDRKLRQEWPERYRE